MPLRIHQLWRTLLLWLVALALAQAQENDNNDLEDGELTRFKLSPGASATFQLDPPSDSTESSSSSSSGATTYQVTLNICSAPSAANFTALKDTKLLYAAKQGDSVSDSSSSSTSNYGFLNVTRTHSSSGDKGITIVVDAPALSNADKDEDAEWTFELGATTAKDALHILNRTPLFSVEDTDNSSLLLTSPTFFPSLSPSKGGGDPGSQLFILPTSPGEDPSSDPFVHLSKSACFVTRAQGLLSDDDIEAKNTTRGTFTLRPEEGAIGVQKEQHDDGGLRTQFHVTGLDSATNYSIWGMQNTTDGGSRLFRQQFALTKSSDHCRLVFGLSPCSQVAYAVPAPPEMSTDDLTSVYLSKLETSLKNFNTTLHTFSCGIPSQGRFSSVRTCEDCFEAYENWLCGVTMPRCTDVPQELQSQAQDNFTTHARANDQVVFSDEPIPESVQPLLVRDHPALSRTPQWAPSNLSQDLTTPFPYAEVLPCDGVCHLVAASCPSLISWACPVQDQTLAASYGKMPLLQADNIQGGNQAGPAGEPRHRAMDRFGNVWCNSFDIEALLDMRAGSAVSLMSGSRAMLACSSLMTLWLAFGA